MSDRGHPPPQPPSGAWQPAPPMYPPAGPAYSGAALTERRRSRWLTIGLPLGALLVLGGCGAAVALAINAFSGAVGPAMDVGSSYASALVDQRWDDAHAMLCDDAQTGVTADQLAAQYGEPPMTGYSIEGVRVHSSGGQSSAEVTVRFVTENGLDELTVLPLVQDGGDWRPCPDRPAAVLCGRRESNPHARRHQILSLAWLPLHHSRAASESRSSPRGCLEGRRGSPPADRLAGCRGASRPSTDPAGDRRRP